MSEWPVSQASNGLLYGLILAGFKPSMGLSIYFNFLNLELHHVEQFFLPISNKAKYPSIETLCIVNASWTLFFPLFNLIFSVFELF